MGIIEAYNKYISTEIPLFKTKWVTDDFNQ